MTGTEIIKIFEKIGFPIKEDSIFGKVISFTPEEAYLFSTTTGAKYLYYQNGITMKGRAEVFIHRSVFSNNYLIYSPGLFGRTIDGFLKEGNSSRNLKEKYPEIFSGEKSLIIYDISNESSNIENKIYTKILKSGKNPQNYLLYKNFLSNILGESFQEYLASIFFIKQGYVVENQVPWFQQNYKYRGSTLQGGIPDFSAFTCPFLKYLYKLGIIDENNGISINLLPTIINFRTLKEKNIDKDFSHHLIIGEAKTTSSSLPQALTQLKKYNSVNLADSLFTIIPNSNTNNLYGSMYIDDSYNLIFKKGKDEELDLNNKIIDSNWLDTYIKVLLLGNISFNEILDFINTFRKTNHLELLDNYESIHLLDAVQNTSNEEYYNYIRRILWPTQAI